MSIASIAENITSKLVEQDAIGEEQQEEYVYALTLIISIVITDITALIIGWAMGMFFECVGFCFIYRNLRKYCGGFHFGTSLKCYLSTCVMCPVALLMVKHLPENFLWWSVAWVMFSAVTFVLSPVEALNKPLDEAEQKMFGKIARIMIVVLSVCYLVFALLRLGVCLKVMTVSMMFVTLFAIIGKAQLHYVKK